MPTRTATFAFVMAASALLLGGCERAPDATDAPAGSPTTEPSPGPPVPAPAVDGGEIDATQVVDRAPVADAAPDFDVRAFAGTFTAEGARLRLAADGTYALSVHAESADADLETTGTWTVEAGGSELLLDPDSKEAPDRRYTITSNDALTAADGGQVLRRDGA